MGGVWEEETVGVAAADAAVEVIPFRTCLSLALKPLSLKLPAALTPGPDEGGSLRRGLSLPVSPVMPIELAAAMLFDLADDELIETCRSRSLAGNGCRNLM